MKNQLFWTIIPFWVEKTFKTRMDAVFNYGEVSKFLRICLEEEVIRRESAKKSA